MIALGKIINTHGIRGELKINLYADFEVFSKAKTLHLKDGRSHTLLSCRLHKSFALATLEGIEDVSSAMALKNKEVFAYKKELELPEDHYFYMDIYGFDVHDLRTDAIIGTLKEVQQMPSCMMYVVAAGDALIYIPEVPAFKRSIDHVNRQIHVETIRGMLPDED